MDERKLLLSQGKYAKVDGAMFAYLSQWKWTYDKTGYIHRKEKGKKIYLHRLIMNDPLGLFVDHRNRDRLDNRSSNLRLCTKQENNMNCNKRGVIKYGNRWYAQIMRDGKNYAKTFKDKVQAIDWYNQKSKELHGNFGVQLGRSVL